MKQKQSFTLVELLIVIIIIGVLAMIAVPQYQNIMERAKSPEAFNMLSLIAKAQSVYYAQWNTYAPWADYRDDAQWSKLGLDNPNKTNGELTSKYYFVYDYGPAVEPAQIALGIPSGTPSAVAWRKTNVPSTAAADVDHNQFILMDFHGTTYKTKPY